MRTTFLDDVIFVYADRVGGTEGYIDWEDQTVLGFSGVLVSYNGVLGEPAHLSGSVTEKLNWSVMPQMFVDKDTSGNQRRLC